MRIEDVFTGPDGAIAVTGRVRGTSIPRGSRLHLVDGMSRHEVVVSRFLRFCGRHDPEVARDGENTVMILDGLPTSVDVRGLMLLSSPEITLRT